MFAVILIDDIVASTCPVSRHRTIERRRIPRRPPATVPAARAPASAVVAAASAAPAAAWSLAAAATPAAAPTERAPASAAPAATSAADGGGAVAGTPAGAAGVVAGTTGAVLRSTTGTWAAMVGVSRNRAQPDDAVLVHAPLFHTMALFWQTLPTIWSGGAVVLVPKFSVSRFWDISLKHGCTHTFLQPVMATLAASPIPEHSYQRWITGLEVPRLEEAFGLRIQSSWGMTEVVTSVLINDPAAPSVDGSIGRVGPEYSIRIVSEATGEDAEQGELRVSGVRGLSLFAGYHRNPEATAEGFDELGMWCTGDLVRVLPSGDIQFVSRIKDMLRVGGENVAAAEIERVLVEHPAVTAAGVVGHPDQYRGEVAVGFVVAPGIDDDPASLAAFEAEAIEHCSERLAGFKVPRRVHVIEELPESLVGKTSKKILSEQALALGLGGESS